MKHENRDLSSCGVKSGLAALAFEQKICSTTTYLSYVFFQRRLYAAQAARKVEFTGAADLVKFELQEAQVSGC